MNQATHFLTVIDQGDPRASEELLPLDDALPQLEAEDPVKARLVKLQFFAGVSLDDAAAMLGSSPATSKRYWIYARSWLYRKGRLPTSSRSVACFSGC